MRFYLGFEYGAIKNWESVHPPIEAPSNYKKPEAINAYVESRLLALVNGGAAKELMTSMLKRAVILQRGVKSTEERPQYRVEGKPESGDIENDGDPQVIFDLSGDHVGRQLLMELMNRVNLTNAVGNASDIWQRVGLFGLGIRRALRVAALDWLHGEGHLPMALWWTLEADRDFRYNQLPGFIDPVSLLFGSSSIPPTVAAFRFGLPPVDQADALSCAEFTYALVGSALGM